MPPLSSSIQSAQESARSGRTLLLIFLVVLAFASVWAYVFLQQKPRVADGAVEMIRAVPIHTELRQGGTLAQGYGGGVAESDEELVWVQLRITNLTKAVPLYATGERATLTFPDGEQSFAFAQSASEIARARSVLHQLNVVSGPLLPPELTLAPGASTRGLVLFAFPIAPKQWNGRRNLSVEVSFQNQRPLGLREPNPPVSDMMPDLSKSK